jgi:hypothetical protein
VQPQPRHAALRVTLEVPSEPIHLAAGIADKHVVVPIEAESELLTPSGGHSELPAHAELSRIGIQVEERLLEIAGEVDRAAHVSTLVGSQLASRENAGDGGQVAHASESLQHPVVNKARETGRLGDNQPAPPNRDAFGTLSPARLRRREQVARPDRSRAADTLAPMLTRPERPSDADYYERERVALLSHGNLFRDVPLAYPLPADELVVDEPARGGRHRFLSGPLKFGPARLGRCPRPSDSDGSRAHGQPQCDPHLSA